MVSRVNTDAVGMCVSAVSAAQHAASVESASACSPLDEKADAINAVAMLISARISFFDCRPFRILPTVTVPNNACHWPSLVRRWRNG